MDDSWALFDRLADGFDEVVPMFAGLGVQLIELLDPAPGARLLDLGAGRGAVAVPAARRGCAVTAVDAAPRMVELLARDHPGLDVRLMDAHALDLPDGGYDLATAACVIHLVAEPARVLAELRRVLRPGGTVALTVPGPSVDGGRWDAFQATVREYEPLAHRPSWPDPPDVPALLRDAGFVEVRSVGVEVHLPIADPETCWRFQMSHGFAGFVAALAPADAAELRSRAMAHLTAMHAAGGIILDRGATVHLASTPGR